MGSEFKVGDWVRFERVTGTILEIDAKRKHARLCVNNMEVMVPLKKLVNEVLPNPPPPGASPIRIQHGGPPIRYEIDLHGMRVEEALEAADRGIDQAIVNHLASFKIIHGHGSGALRHAIRQLLSQHPYVESFRFGSPIEGGIACTVVQLRTSRVPFRTSQP